MGIRLSHTLLLCVFFVSATAFGQIPKFSKVSEGIYRGAQPAAVEDYDFLIEQGVRSIINLQLEGRTVDREKERWHAALERHHALGYFFSVPMSWIRMPSKQKLELILGLMTQHELGPVFIHCTQGKDRTGLMVALYRIQMEHWGFDSAYKEMRSFGYNRWLIRLKQALKRYSKPGSLKPRLSKLRDLCQKLLLGQN